MVTEAMDRGIDAGLSGRGESFRRLAAVAFTLLAFAALPLSTADRGLQPLADVTGPDVTAVTLNPIPVVPDVVSVFADAVDALSNVTAAEFWIDVPGPNGTSLFPMSPTDGAWDSPTEGVWWGGTYTAFTLAVSAGPHVLFVHAMDEAGNWGDSARLDFVHGSPQTIGPSVVVLDVSPVDVPRGAAVTITAVFQDAFGDVVRQAEFFVDALRPDGNGTWLPPADGLYDSSMEAALWTGVLLLTPGDHVIFVHAQDTWGAWGSTQSFPFTARAPAFSLQLLADVMEARPDEFVTLTLPFENRGNGPATTAWINLSLPSELEYRSDTAASVGGNRTGTSFAFANVAPGAYSFGVRTQVAADATDGSLLDMQATLDYVNEVGFLFPTVSANVGATVIAPELAVHVAGPGTAYAAESATLSIRIEHTGIRSIPSLDVELDASPWVVVEADTSRTLGGLRVGEGAWRFTDLVPGVHVFQVTERIASTAPDRLSLARTATVSYVSRQGSPTTIFDSASLAVQRPSFSMSISADRRQISVGEQIALLVTYVNGGSATAASAQVRIVLPSGLALAGGDPPARSTGSEHVWERTNVAPGSHTLSVVVQGNAAASASVSLELTYTSPGGEPLQRVSSAILLGVDQVPPPVSAIFAGLATSAFVVALGGYLGTERGKSAFFFLLVPLYTRLQRDHVLDHETRGMIRGYIVANPGDHYNSIKEALELPNGTLAYHLQVLHKEELVRSVKDGKFRRFYPFEMRVPTGGQPTKIQRVILDMIRANPGVTPHDLAGLLGITSSTVSYHLEKLDELGLVEFRREGITKRLYVRSGVGK